MAKPRFGEIRAGTAEILGTAIFLLLWSVVEGVTGTEPKSGPPEIAHQAADQVCATLIPGDPSRHNE